jgi:hypothetical protein
MTFGRRMTPPVYATSAAAAAPAASAATAAAEAAAAAVPTPAMRWAIIGALCVVAMLAALHVWFNIFHIPLQRPSPSLFSNDPGGPSSLWMGPGEKPKAGWTAWYVPVLVTAFWASVILARLTRRRERWSVLSLAAAGCVAVLTGAAVACWTEHNGFMWYNRPDMTLRDLLAEQGKLAVTSFREALAMLAARLPVLLIGAAAGAGCALAVRAPLRRGAEAIAIQPVDDPTDLTPRILSTVVLMIVNQIGNHHGHPYYMLAAGGCISLAWFTVAFRRVEFRFKRVVQGALVAAILGALVQNDLLMHKDAVFQGLFKDNPYASNIVFMKNLMSFAGFFILYFLGLIIIFTVLAKVTVSLCRRPAT